VHLDLGILLLSSRVRFIPSICLSLALAGCSEKSKPLTPQALQTHARITISIASEISEFCSLREAGKVRDTFPDKHLQDVGKQLQESKNELEQLVADDAQRETRQRLLHVYDELQSGIAELHQGQDARCDNKKFAALADQVRAIKTDSGSDSGVRR
jgi:hypothetical protein